MEKTVIHILKLVKYKGQTKIADLSLLTKIDSDQIC